MAWQVQLHQSNCTEDDCYDIKVGLNMILLESDSTLVLIHAPTGNQGWLCDKLVCHRCVHNSPKKLDFADSKLIFHGAEQLLS